MHKEFCARTINSLHAARLSRASHNIIIPFAWFYQMTDEQAEASYLYVRALISLSAAPRVKLSRWGRNWFISRSPSSWPSILFLCCVRHGRWQSTNTRGNFLRVSRAATKCYKKQIFACPSINIAEYLRWDTYSLSLSRLSHSSLSASPNLSFLLSQKRRYS